MQKRWQKISGNYSTTVIKKLQESLGVSSTLAELMASRGITSFEEAREFFNPSEDQLHDPFKMLGMKTAVERIVEAIDRKEKILIYGDYDVDGTTSVALLTKFLKSAAAEVSFYIPDRFKEGYGISFQGIDEAAKRECKLIIALDCGIKAIEQVKYANQLGIDLIICDHHNPGEELPKAFSILNPKQPNDQYPYKFLSGCGVGFKLCQALHSAGHGSSPFNFIDLVAISAAADIVPITGENRVLTHLGIQKINTDPLPAIEAMKITSDYKKPFNVTDLVFKIGPRINAAGRIRHASMAVDLLLEDDVENASRAAAEVDQNNNSRRLYDSEMTQEALHLIENDEHSDQKITNVLYNPEWHKGVIGIVASRVIEKHYKPTILLTESNGKAVGSGRSIPGFDLYAALLECSEYLEQFGGHTMAAGMSMNIENIESFSKKFEEVVQSQLTDELRIPLLEYELELDLSEINLRFLNTLKRFGPFGPENMNPLFISRAVKNKYEPRIVGDNHLKISIDGENGTAFNAIAFQMGDKFDIVSSSEAYDICYTLEKNEWNNKVDVQLNIKDIQSKES